MAFLFFLHRYRKRKLFFAGASSGGGSSCTSSPSSYGRSISGATQGGRTRALLCLPAGSGHVHCGMTAGSVDCEEIARDLRAAYSDLVWVSASVQGTKLVIQVKENSHLSAKTQGKLQAAGEAGQGEGGDGPGGPGGLHHPVHGHQKGDAPRPGGGPGEEGGYPRERQGGPEGRCGRGDRVQVLSGPGGHHRGIPDSPTRTLMAREYEERTYEYDKGKHQAAGGVFPAGRETGHLTLGWPEEQLPGV